MKYTRTSRRICAHTCGRAHNPFCSPSGRQPIRSNCKDFGKMYARAPQFCSWLIRARARRRFYMSLYMQYTVAASAVHTRMHIHNCVCMSACALAINLRSDNYCWAVLRHNYTLLPKRHKHTHWKFHAMSRVYYYITGGIHRITVSVLMCVCVCQGVPRGS